MKAYLGIVVAMVFLVFSGCSGGGGSSSGGGSSGSSDNPVVKKARNPVANAGGNRNGITTKDMSNVQTQEIIFLDGSSSYGSSYEWEIVSKPKSTARFYFISNKSNSTGVYGDTAGVYKVKLTVKNADNKAVWDIITVTLLEDEDGDGIKNSDDLDRDGDGFLNTNDAFPDDKVSHIDSDGDGNGNYKSDDTDGDGFKDVDDDFPLNSAKHSLDIFNEAKENDNSFNKNDGISIAENSLNAPLRIKGKLYSTDSSKAVKTDSDFYAIYFSAGTYSVVVDESNSDMDVLASVVDSKGQSVSSVATDMSSLNKALVSILIPTDGTYYLIITDAHGKSGIDWNYEAKVFSDSDMDGLSDEFEQAIESNHNTLDSDGDGISDFIEVYYSYDKNLSDVDHDNIPNWWDYDSDNDGLADSIEFYTQDDKPDMSKSDINFLNDIDEDGIPNFLDTDSDGNKVLDHDEIGTDYVHPIDTDGDSVPDYLDVDNDNDGINDINEKAGAMNKRMALPGEETSFKDSLIIKSFKNTDLDVDKVCQANTSVEIKLDNVPSGTTSALLTFKGLKGTINKDVSIDTDGKITFICPSDIQSGQVEFFITVNNSMRTLSEDLLYVDVNTPIITEVSFNVQSNRLEIKGSNLNYDMTINLNGKSYSYNNRYRSSTSLNYTLSSSALKSGMVSVANSAGTSNQVYVAIKRNISVQIDSPNKSLDLTKMDLSMNKDDYTPDSSGRLTMPVAVDSPTVVTSLIVDTSKSVNNPDYTPYLYAVALPNTYTLTLNAHSTALALVYSGLGIDKLIKDDELASALGKISELSEVKDFEKTIESELKTANNALVSQSANFKAKSKAALLAAATYLEHAISDKTYTKRFVPRKLTKKRGIYGEDATVTPSGVLDSMQVYERDDTGDINIYNDTQLYLSVRVTDMKGALLQDHVESYFSSNLVGPQGYGLLFWASTKKLDLPHGKNCNVEIVSPGIMTLYEPKILALNSTNPSTRAVYKYLVFRTLIERVAWPVLAEVFGDEIGKNDFINILYSNAPSLVDIVVGKVAKNDMKGAMKSMLDLLWQDFFTQPPGPVTTAIATKVFGNAAKNVVKDFAEKQIKKIAKKIGMAAVPALGEIAMAYEVAGHLNNGLNAAGALYDLDTKDSVTSYSVVFPVTFAGITPSKIIPDDSTKTFFLNGSGFSEVKEHWYSLLGTKPKITFTDHDGQSIELTPKYIKPDGTEMSVDVPGYYLTKDIKGPLDVEIHHPTFKPDSKIAKKSAVSIVSKVTLSSVSPSEGSTGIKVTLYGSGFSNQTSNNQVTIDGKAALIVDASEDRLQVMIPPSLAEGSYQIVARSKNSNTWTEWSNSVSYTVKLSNVSIVVCDNGLLKDDAFQLYVNKALVGSIYATNSHYCATFNPTVHTGTNSAMLQGIEAPDGVGTYSISFSGLKVQGASLKGNDLTPGIVKNYTFEVSENSSRSLKRSLVVQPYIPFKAVEE